MPTVEPSTVPVDAADAADAAETPSPPAEPVNETAPAPPAKPASPRPLLLSHLQVSGVDADDAADVEADLAAAFARVPDVVFRTGGSVCADAAAAADLAAARGSDVIWGSLSQGEGLFTLDVHLHEAHRGGSVVRARLEAPDLSTLQKQIDDAAVRMLGGEPQPVLSPWLVTGGLLGGVGVAAVVVGGAGTGWCLWVGQDDNAAAATKKTADDLWLPSLITLGAGAVVAVVGISMVGLSDP